ncbi:MAG: hypothetical protein DRG50_04450 [Deltaproteobacteria bacterium]|nr:MAG: hypothetical protein DRG50_04450 [Deltaproteobacteria bacterium]
MDRQISIRVLRWLVRRPSTYRLLGVLLEVLNRKEKNEAYKIWVRFLLEVTQKAYAHRRPVIWMNAFTPSEIAYALGGVPFMPEIIASLVSYLGWSRRPISLADTYISTDVCSFYRCALGLVLEGYLPHPDLIISSSHLCDGANKFFRYLSKLYGCPHFFLDPPYKCDTLGRRYMISQLKEVVEAASGLIHVPLDEGRLAQTIDLSNQARRYMEDINRLRQNIPSPFPGSEGLSYLAGMNFYSLGSERGVDFYRTLYHYIERKVVKAEGYLLKERHRLLWLHHIRPYYENEIFQILGDRGVAVSFEEPNYLYWPSLDPSRPWESLAEKITSNIWAGPLDRRIEAVWRMVQDYSIDGVIHFSHWGCRQSCGGAGVIGDFLKEKGVPYIILPGDGADPDNYSPGQTRTRLEALVEMLG